MAALTMGSGLSAPGFRRQLLVLGNRFWAINAGRELKSKWLNPVTHNVYTCTFRIESAQLILIWTKAAGIHPYSETQQ